MSCAVSCTDTGNEPEGGFQGVPTIEVTPASMQIGLAGGTTEAVTVTTAAEWVVEADTEGVVASMQSGNGNATVTFEVPATEAMRTIKVTFTATGYVSGYPITKKASLSITQTDSDIPTVDGEFVYYENGGESVSKVDGYWPYVDKYTGWNPQGGEGFDQSGVTYTGKNASVRNSGKTWAPVGATYATDAPYAYLQAKTDSQFVINNINIKSGVKNYTFSFTAFNQYASLKASPYTPVVAALESGKNLSIAVSVDGENWGIVAFTTMADGNWTYAIAPFTLPADADKLFVRFSDYKADTTTALPSEELYDYQAALRFDDFRLVEGGNGPVVEFNNAGGGSGEVVEGTIDAILAGGEGNYSLKNAWVVATYGRGCLITDASGKYILCYMGTEATIPAVGAVVDVDGAVTTYAGLLQFGADAKVTATGETKTVDNGTAAAMTGADLDAYVSAPVVKYASFEGALVIDGNYYNVTVEGASTAVGSLSYPDGDIKTQLTSLNGKGIKVTGYLIGVSSGKFTNMMVTAVSATGDDPEQPEPTTASKIDKVASLVAGNYIMAGYLESYDTYNWAANPYHCWTGKIATSSNKNYLETVAYSYADGVLSPGSGVLAQPAVVTVVAVEGKANTFYIKTGNEYLVNNAASNHQVGLSANSAEWVAADHAKGGIVFTSNGAYLGTGNATKNHIRSYIDQANLACGVVFFTTDGTVVPEPDPTPDPEPDPTPSQAVAINTITADGTYTVEGIVVAVAAKAYVIADQTGSLLVYGAEHGRTLMEKVTIEGTVSRYKGYNTNSLQMAATTTTVVSTDNTYEYKPLVVDGATLDAMVGADAACIEVQVTGVISVGSYANITVEGATKQASLYYVNTADYAAFNGKNVVVKGYVTGTYNYLNILPYSVTEVGGSTPTPDPDPTPDPTPGVKAVTVAEFLAAAEDSTVYELTGVISNVTNTTYGNFDLTDSTGTVLIYGLCSPAGEAKYWAASGAKEGDTITVQTVRSSYNGTLQGKNAIFVKLVAGEGGTTEPTPEPTPITGNYSLIDTVAALSAGDYIMSGYLTSYTSGDINMDWSAYPYHCWTGAADGKDCATANYAYADGALTIDPACTTGTAATITLEAVADKANTYYIKSNGKYLYSSAAATNRKLALGDTPAEWVATANANGGITLSSNSVYLGTAGAQSKMIRSYKAETTLKYGVVFFKANN